MPLLRGSGLISTLSANANYKSKGFKMNTIINPVRVNGIPTVVFVADTDATAPLVIGASQDVTPETLINLFGEKAPMVCYVYNFPKKVVVTGNDDEELDYFNILFKYHEGETHATDKIYRHMRLKYFSDVGVKLVQEVTLTRIERDDKGSVTLYEDLLIADTLENLMRCMYNAKHYGNFIVVDAGGDSFLVPHKMPNAPHDLYYNSIFDIPTNTTDCYHTCPEMILYHQENIHYAENKGDDLFVDGEFYLSDLYEEIDEMFDEWNSHRNIQPIVKFSPINELI